MAQIIYKDGTFTNKNELFENEQRIFTDFT